MENYNASLLRLAREQEGLTQKGLAEKLNVKQAVLSPEVYRQRYPDFGK